MVYLENNGTPKGVDLSIKVKQKLEDLGVHVEHTVGRDQDDLFLYDEDMKLIGKFNTEPSAETLLFFLNLRD